MRKIGRKKKERIRERKRREIENHRGRKGQRYVETRKRLQRNSRNIGRGGRELSKSGLSKSLRGNNYKEK